MDLEPNMPTIIALYGSNIFGEASLKKYVYCTPKPGKFYCLEASYDSNGYIELGFIDLQTCEKMIR